MLSFNLNGNAIILPHLQWLYGNHYQPGQFEYGKEVVSRTVTGITQNSSSDKKYPSSGSWDYTNVMRELDKQSNKKLVTIQLPDQNVYYQKLLSSRCL